jgi:hypothetical protein
VSLPLDTLSLHVPAPSGCIFNNTILSSLLHFTYDHMVVDGIRGRISYVESKLPDSGTLIVVDIK